MMLIHTKSGTQRRWLVGEKKPEGSTFDGYSEIEIPYDDVSEVQVDGQELEYIRSMFKNLPDISGRTLIQWKGVFAQFIYDNM